MEGHCTSETHPFLGATPWFNVPAAPPNEQQRLRGVRKRATALAVCGEDAQYARLRRPRAVPRWLWSVHALRKGTEPARSLSTSVQDRAPDVPAVAFNEQPASRRTQARYCVGCLWGGGAARTLTTRARRAALVVIGPCPTKGYCTGKKPSPLGARPCSNVPAVASNERPPFAWRTKACHCVDCLWGGDAACALATRARRAALAVVGTCPM